MVEARCRSGPAAKVPLGIKSNMVAFFLGFLLRNCPRSSDMSDGQLISGVQRFLEPHASHFHYAELVLQHQQMQSGQVTLDSSSGGCLSLPVFKGTQQNLDAPQVSPPLTSRYPYYNIQTLIRHCLRHHLVWFGHVARDFPSGGCPRWPGMRGTLRSFDE